MESKKLPLMDKYPGSFYQPLFDLMKDQHGLILLSSEMSDIIEMVRRLDQSQTGVRWVKASEFKFVEGAEYFYKYEYLEKHFKGVAKYDDGMLWSTKTTVLPVGYTELYILDESAAGREEVACDFAEWLYKNRWFSFENNKWYYTFEQGTSMSDKQYQKEYVKTTAELYELFKQQKEK